MVTSSQDFLVVKQCHQIKVSKELKIKEGLSFALACKNSDYVMLQPGFCALAFSIRNSIFMSLYADNTIQDTC